MSCWGSRSIFWRKRCGTCHSPLCKLIWACYTAWAHLRIFDHLDGSCKTPIKNRCKMWWTSAKCVFRLRHLQVSKSFKAVCWFWLFINWTSVIFPEVPGHHSPLNRQGARRLRVYANFSTSSFPETRMLTSFRHPKSQHQANGFCRSSNYCDVMWRVGDVMILDPKLWSICDHPTWDIDKLSELSKDPIPWRVHFLLLAWPLAHLGLLNPCRGGSFQGDIKVKRYEQVINLNWTELDWTDSKQNYSIRKGSEKDSCLTPGRHSESACSRVARPPGPLLQQWLRWRPWLPPQKEHRRLDGIGPLVGCNSSDSGFW